MVVITDTGGEKGDSPTEWGYNLEGVAAESRRDGKE